MKVLYQSELTGKTYETKEALIEDENKVSEAKKQEEAKRQERAAAAKEVDARIKEANEANKKAHEALAEFCEKYGSYKTTIDEKSDWVDWVFNPFKMLEAFL